MAYQRKKKSQNAEIPKKEEAPVLLVNQASASKWKGWWTRVMWSWAMVLGFCGIIAGGHLYVILFVMAIQFACFKEIITIAFLHSSASKNNDGSDKGGNAESKVTKLPLFRTLNWYFLLSANYFFYGASVTRWMLQFVPSELKFLGSKDQLIGNLKAHHNFISFSLYCLGFVVFVVTLKKGFYRFQFSQFGWTHVTLLVVVSASYFVICNIFEGLIWFLLPVFIIICNDCTAYIFGFFFGRTPLIDLSPKKTWEGFMGAFFSTLLFAFFAGRFFGIYDYFICPIQHLTFAPVVGTLTCQPNAIFLPEELAIPEAIAEYVGFDTITVYPVQYHAVIFAFFGSIIAPFGGFFASGFKRAFGIKDFGDLIPGHGGVMDRFDCQFLMSTFINVYYSSFIATAGFSALTFSMVIESISVMSKERQLEIYNSLRKSLIEQGQIEA